MFKKIVSYLIIFSILYTDMGHCGSVGGRETLPPERDDTRKIRIRQHAESKKHAETMPLMMAIGKRNNDPVIPNLPKNFSFESFTETSQAQSLALYNRGEGLEEDTDETEVPVKHLSEWKRSSRNGSVNHSEVDVIPVNDPLIHLEEESEEEPDSPPTVQWHQESTSNPRSSYDSDSVRDIQLFFEDFLSHHPDGPQIPLTAQSLVINQEDSDQDSSTSAQELKDFVLVGNLISGELIEMDSDEFPNLSPQFRAFLRYVKRNVVDGELNWKQKLGIVGGIIMGAGVAWPWIWIMFTALLDPYANDVERLDVSNPNWTPDFLTTEFRSFNSYINFKTMIGFVGIPMGINAASQTASIFMDYAADNTQFFSRLKNKNHERALLATKSCMYFGAFFSGLLPICYLYNSLLGCDLTTGWAYTMNGTKHNYIYGVSTDFFLNISDYRIFSNKSFLNCTQTPDFPPEKLILFKVVAPFLFFSIFLRYGHQVSKSATDWINHYFFNQDDATSQIPAIEAMRQEYLTKFKVLSRVHEGSEGNFYDYIFNKKTNEHHSEKYTTNEAIRILKLFNKIPVRQKAFIEEDTEIWKKTWATRIGWAVSLISTMGRMVIFQFVIDQLLGSFWTQRVESYDPIDVPALGADILSYIFGFSLAHLSQGWVEKEAVEEGIYEILGGKKFLEERSHSSLRIGIKIWDYLYGCQSALKIDPLSASKIAPPPLNSIWVKFNRFVYIFPDSYF